MKSFKTLKDLQKHRTGGTPCILTWELRSEAIKEVKERLKIKYNEKDYAKSRIEISYIKEKNNIIEEDLK